MSLESTEGAPTESTSRGDTSECNSEDGKGFVCISEPRTGERADEAMSVLELKQTCRKLEGSTLEPMGVVSVGYFYSPTVVQTKMRLPGRA